MRPSSSNITRSPADTARQSDGSACPTSACSPAVRGRRTPCLLNTYCTNPEPSNPVLRRRSAVAIGNADVLISRPNQACRVERPTSRRRRGIREGDSTCVTSSRDRSTSRVATVGDESVRRGTTVRRDTRSSATARASLSEARIATCATAPHRRHRARCRVAAMRPRRSSSCCVARWNCHCRTRTSRCPRTRTAYSAARPTPNSASTSAPHGRIVPAAPTRRFSSSL